MTLAWMPVSGASSYILSWRLLRGSGQGKGKARVGRGVGSVQGLLGNSVLSSAEVPAAPQTLPGISGSQRVTGLEPGHSYVFSLTPVREGVRGPESSITQSPGLMSMVRWRLSRSGMHPSGDTMSGTWLFPAGCPRGLADVVFLVHATRDNAHRAGAVRRVLERLVSALGPLGPQAVQVRTQRHPDTCLSLTCPPNSMPVTGPYPSVTSGFLLAHP